MSQATSNTDRQEASLFSDEFTAENTETEEESKSHPPEDNRSTEYAELKIGGATELLDTPSNEIISAITHWEQHEQLINADSEEKQGAEFSAVFNREDLKYIVDAHRGHIERAHAAVTEDGIFIGGVDTDNTAMLHTWVSKHDLQQLDIEQKGVFQIDSNELHQTLVELKTTGKIELGIETPSAITQEDEKACIKLEDKEGDVEMTEIPHPESFRELPSIPEVHLSSNLKLPLGELGAIISRYNEYSDHFKLKSHKDGLEFYAEGDTTEVSKTYETTADLATDFGDIQNVMASTQPGDSTFLSIDLVRNYFKRLRKSHTDKSATIWFGDDFPAQVKTKITNRSFITEYIAPRIMSD